MNKAVKKVCEHCTISHMQLNCTRCFAVDSRGTKTQLKTIFSNIALAGLFKHCYISLINYRIFLVIIT